ncbi:Free fatty acid receptor 3 G-protein coupled receptor 41 [Larimichthys crocea]|uniref:Free fatty acid receptor 3 G-protein coupled receptor 41 n=1 Tax=Larimichthys crocea TaxID=215358 RepID=A0A6G0ICS8_LARCR|nr:Free fatty acid receptor 3 G-protein coupled receptor 41 [Larimichthys crocea]
METVVRTEVILSVYIISFLIGLPANLLALYAFSVKIHSKPLLADILLLNLIISDLLFLIILPLKMHEAASGMIWTLPKILCTFTSFTFFSTIYTSSLLLMAVSVIRYIGVAFPITYHQLQKPVYAIVISAIIWLISAAHCSIVFAAQHHPSESENSTVCYENFNEKQLEILLPVRLEFFFVLCLIPLVICVYCYLRCILILYSRPRISRMQKQKAIGMALGTLAVFLVCVVPYNISHLVGYFRGESPKWRAIMETVVRTEVILSVYIISFLIGLPANLLALYAFSVKIHSKPLLTDILLLNLIISDLLFLIILPLKMHEAASGMIWTLPKILCSFTSFTFFFAIYTSSLLLMAVSVIRYIGVAFPITYHQLQKPVYAIVISAIILLISAAHCSTIFITQHHPSLQSENSTVCYENFNEKQLEILLPVRLEAFFVLCLIPLLICVYCYLRCILILYSRPRIPRTQKQKAIGMALGTLAVFLVCVLPFNISHLVGYFQGESPKWRAIMETVVRTEVILSVYIISFLIGLPANLLALYAFSVKIHSKPLPTDILLLNLIISDLLFLIILPLKMHEAASGMIWTLPKILCSFTSFTFFSTIYTSSLLLMAVSVIRYIGVAFPITYHQLQKPVYAIVISCIIWLISAAHCSIVFATQHHPSLQSENSTVCYENFNEKQLEILLPARLEFFFVLCLIPLLICVYCYLRCILILYSRPRISRMQKQKAIGMALGTLAVFLVCVVPYNMSHLVGYFRGESPKWRYYTLLFSAFNTCIDPIIFYFSSSAFQCTSEKFIFRKRRCNDSEVQRQGTSSGQEPNARS